MIDSILADRCVGTCVYTVLIMHISGANDSLRLNNALANRTDG